MTFRLPEPYPGELWGFDSGIYLYWKAKKPWEGTDYLRRIDKARKFGHPAMAVLPGYISDGLRSLSVSLTWLNSGRLPDWPWYVPVEDGLTVDHVAPLLDRMAGVYFGGSSGHTAAAKRWSVWCSLRRKKFHYGHCDTPKRIVHAFEVGADSLDSSLPTLASPFLRAFMRYVLAPEVNAELRMA